MKRFQLGVLLTGLTLGGDTAVRVCEGNRCGDQYAENGSHGC